MLFMMNPCGELSKGCPIPRINDMAMGIGRDLAPPVGSGNVHQLLQGLFLQSPDAPVGQALDGIADEASDQ